MAEEKKKKKKNSDLFKNTIKNYLDKLAEEDELFAKTYSKENKNIDDCITYILNTAEKIANSDMLGLADEEVYQMATHYYDEDDIDVGKDVDMKVIVNHKVKLTDEEIEEAKKKAKEDVVREESLRLKQSKNKKAPTPGIKEEKKKEQKHLI